MPKTARNFFADGSSTQLGTQILEEFITTTDSHTSPREVECPGTYRPEVAIALTPIIAILCITGNATVLYIFTRSTKVAETRIFELVFAALDITAGTLILPILTVPSVFCEYEKLVYWNYRLQNVLGASAFTAYYSLLLSVALDRFYAVHFPLKYMVARKSFVKKMLIGVALYTVVVVAFVSVASRVSTAPVLPILFGMSILAILVIVALFIAVVARIARINAQRAALGVGGGQENTKKQHLTAVKVFYRHRVLPARLRSVRSCRISVGTS